MSSESTPEPAPGTGPVAADEVVAAPPDPADPADPAELPDLAVMTPEGRRFTVERRVRWGDTDRHGRLRLDALARYLQDVANDDTRDAGHDPFAPWVVRRTLVVVHRAAALGELVTLTTFSGGHGSRWGDRRTTVTGDQGAHLEVSALWVFVDTVTGRPARLTPEFHATYDTASAGRSVSARLRHGPAEPGADRRPWPLRSTDLDRLGHVNNAATWAAVEDELERRGRAPLVAEIEYPDAIEPGAAVDLLSTESPDGTVRVWLVEEDRVRASAEVRTVAG